MFTGIIRQLGNITSITGTNLGKKIEISSPIFTSGCHLGDSICINGVCLTIVALSSHSAGFDISSETLRKTALVNQSVGSLVNVETSLRVGDTIDGHLVSGHVDTTAEVYDIQNEGNTVEFVFTLPFMYLPYLASKGSISVDGVSLTIGRVRELGKGKVTFSTYVIPHTFSNTIMSTYKVGGAVNIEIDSLARYAVNAIECFNRGFQPKTEPQ